MENQDTSIWHQRSDGLPICTDCRNKISSHYNVRCLVKEIGTAYPTSCNRFRGETGGVK